MEMVQELVSHYGYLAIFCLLALGIIGLPVPDEVLMTFVGYLASVYVLKLPLAFVVAFSGALCGMLLSYTIGRKIGKPLIHRYGKWVKLTPKRLERIEGWFHRYGMWTIVFGYFIPGVRHVTCYISGMSGVRTGQYVIFAGAGALLWSTVFILIGYFLGNIDIFSLFR
ncbi:DedA family protein [Paenibacillus sp. GCM10012307]|uniref:DedA family protein n=1 Tax=Paenibacillus roseus TaxID=2798579 RepID=A0A934IWI4_9BACL|nr:DedA family protein [Paenibacillus roseus]MBJ6360601.1 DedA family protein [Paenibacillus roseus]